MGKTELLEKKIHDGYRVGYEEAVELVEEAPLTELCGLAGRLRSHFHGNYFETCSIMNARSGRCSEDCKWCSQSKFHNTNIEIYPLVSKGEALKQARHNAGKGVRKFSMVTSGRTLSPTDMKKLCDIFEAIDEEVDIDLCASLGLLNKDQLARLKECGVKRYHCNLETAPSYFSELCSTHTTADKIRTINWAREVGLEICSGGIIGMGESMRQRIELAIILREIGVVSIPLNILNPIKGTALEDTEPLTDEEVLRTVAIFTIVYPDAAIRLAGGRTLIKHLENQLLHCGVSASIVGDMLTTTGSDIDTDRKMFTDHGFAV